MVEVAAVLVVAPEKKRSAPPPPVHDGVDDGSGEPLTELDVLRRLLGVVEEARVDNAECRQRARGGAGEERMHPAHVAKVLQDADREHIGGELEFRLELASDGLEATRIGGSEA